MHRLVSVCILAWVLVAAAPKPPLRIASGTVGSDEIIIELLTRARALDRLVAVSIFADDPRYSTLPPLPKSVSGRVGGEPEALLALKPDLVVLAAYNRPELVALLKRAGIKTLVQRRFDSLQDVKNNIIEIGTALGTIDEAKTLVKNMEIDLGKRTDPISNRKTLLFSTTGQIVGADTLLDDCIQWAGGDNLGRKLGVKGWQSIQAEALVSLGPDFILAAGNESERSKIMDQISLTPGFKAIAAKQKFDLILIPEGLMTSVSHQTTKIVNILRTAYASRSRQK